MASWIGRGGGRKPAQPTVVGGSRSPTYSGGGSLDLNSGPGMGSGRPGSQPSVQLSSGRGMGSGRPGSQPSLELSSGSGMGSGRPGSQPSLELNSGPGMGSGRAGSQPTLDLKSGKGMGSGRVGSNVEIAEGSLLGTRSSDSTKQMQSGGKQLQDVADPEGSFVFALEIAGIEVGQFLECSGLKTKTDVFELQEGGMNGRVHKLPGQTRWENIVLRYGVTNDVSVLQWRNEVLQDEFGKDNRRNGAIIVKNNQMETVRRYNFVAAWPVSWEGPNFSASSAELAIETLELAHHGITVA